MPAGSSGGAGRVRPDSPATESTLSADKSEAEILASKRDAMISRSSIDAVLSGHDALSAGGVLRPIFRRLANPSVIASSTSAIGGSHRGDVVILSDGRRTVRAVFQQVAAAHGLTDAAADGAVAAPLLTSSAAAAAGIPRAGASGRESSALITSALNPMETSESVRVQPSVGSIVQLDAFVVERRPTSASGLGDDEPILLVRSWRPAEVCLDEAKSRPYCEKDSNGSSDTFKLTPSPPASSDTDSVGVNSLQPIDAIYAADVDPETASPRPLPLRSAGSPRLPLELQAMILKETLALYRAEDRRAREVEKLRATSRRTLNVSETEGALAADSSRWSLVLVSRNWLALAEPELYKVVSLASARSYDLLGQVLSPISASSIERERARRVRKLIKRAILRDVPSTAWRDASSGWGRVFCGLKELDSLKVRFTDSAEGRIAGLPVRRRAAEEQTDAASSSEGSGVESIIDAHIGQGDAGQVEPSVWATYPNLNPRIYHQHHLSTLVLPAVAQAWPRFRVTSSELVFCMTHPPPMSRVLHLPLKSHHLTVFLAGDIDRVNRFATFLTRLAHGPALGDLRCAIRCSSEPAAGLILGALNERPELLARIRARPGWRFELAWASPGERHSWTVAQLFGAVGPTPTTAIAAGAVPGPAEGNDVPTWLSQHGGFVLGPGGGGLGVAALPEASAADGEHVSEAVDDNTIGAGSGLLMEGVAA